MPGCDGAGAKPSFLRSMALTREAGSDVFARYAVKRKPSAVGVHKYTKTGNKRRRENTSHVPEREAEAIKAEKNRKK